MVVSASTNQLWIKMTIRTYAWSLCHSDPDPSSVFYVLRTVWTVKCIIFASTCSILSVLVVGFYKCIELQKLLQVESKCDTFYGLDGMHYFLYHMMGWFSVMSVSSCLTRNNAQRRFGFDRISSIAFHKCIERFDRNIAHFDFDRLNLCILFWEIVVLAKPNNWYTNVWFASFKSGGFISATTVKVNNLESNL